MLEQQSCTEVFVTPPQPPPRVRCPPPSALLSGYSGPCLCFIAGLAFLAGMGVAVLASSAAALVSALFPGMETPCLDG